MKKRAAADQRRLEKARAAGAQEYVLIDGVLVSAEEAESLER